MRTTLLCIILCVPSLFFAQEKETFEGTIRTAKEQIVPQVNLEAIKQAPSTVPANGVGETLGKAIGQSLVNKVLNQLQSQLNQLEYSITGEYYIITKIKGNKKVEFIPAINKITIYDGDSGEKTEAYPHYKAAVKYPFNMDSPLPLFKTSQQAKDAIDKSTVVTRNGIQAVKVTDQLYTALDYEELYVHTLSIAQANEITCEVRTDITEINEGSIPDEVFKVPSTYKFIDHAKLDKLQKGNKKWEHFSYTSADPIPNDFWNFNK